MAFSIVQSQISASGVSANPTASLTWTSAPTNGNLLVVALTIRTNATVTENTTQGWIQAIGNIRNGTTAQTEIWYRVAGAGEGTTGPAFNIGTAVLYEVTQAEVSGFTGTPTLDKTGSMIATASLTDAVSASSITAGSEFVFAGCGNREGATSGVNFNASTAGGNATIGSPEPITNVNAAKNGEGLRASWATSGASGTSPSITFNLSATTNNNLTAGIATFKGVVAAAVAGTIIRGARWPYSLRARSHLTQPAPPVVVVTAAAAQVMVGRLWPKILRSRSQIVIATPFPTSGFSPSRPIRRATPQRPPTRAHPQLFQPPVTVVITPTAGVVLRGARWPQVQRAHSRIVIQPPYTGGGITPSLVRGRIWPAVRRAHGTILAPPYTGGGITPQIVRGILRKPGPVKPSHAFSGPPYNSGGILGRLLQGLKRKPGPSGRPRLFQPAPPAAAPGVQPLVSRGHTWPVVRRARGTILRPPYTGGGIQPQQTQGIRRKPAPGRPSHLVTPPPYTGGGITPFLKRGILWPAVRHTPPQRFTPPFVPPGIQPIVTQGIRRTATKKILRPAFFTPPFTIVLFVPKLPAPIATPVQGAIASPQPSASSVSVVGAIASPQPTVIAVPVATPKVVN